MSNCITDFYRTIYGFMTYKEYINKYPSFKNITVEEALNLLHEEWENISNNDMIKFQTEYTYLWK